MKKQTLALSLIEIIVVIILITTISSALGISVYKYLETGKAFKTHQNIEKIKAALDMQIQRGSSFSFSESNSENNEKVDNWKEVIRKNLFFSDKKNEYKDGWGKEFTVSFSKEDEEFTVFSESYEKYIQKYGPLDILESDE